MADSRLQQITAPSIGRQFMERMLRRLQEVLQRQPVDLDYLHFVLSHEMGLVHSFANVVELPQDVVRALSDVLRILRLQEEQQRPLASSYVEVVAGSRGQPKFVVSKEHLQNLIDMQLSIPCIAKLLGVCKRTVFRRMQEEGLSVKGSYSNLTNEELDTLVRSVKLRMPHVGYRMMKGELQAMGHRVRWEQVSASMHRVDSAGIFERFTGLGCVARRIYSVKGPHSLVHVDTNHKLIRYGIVIFAGIDGYSRKIMYLGASNNNKASTALGFFMSSVEKFGFPLRVRGDQGVENVGIAHCMFTVRGCGRASYISGKSVHNQRVERLWRDVWMAITCVYYELLHSLEEDCLLDPSNSLHLFCAHYVFVPRLQRDLDTFKEGWDNHAMRTEQNLTPNQLWTIGLLQNPVPAPQNLEHIQDLFLDWNHDGVTEESASGVILPPIQCPEFWEKQKTILHRINKYKTRPNSACVTHFLCTLNESRRKL
ncbi:uncharacterized protein zgc:174680 [Etheostoma spectabile]|uniref:uncharacterized protein zgc:174680 n=1 Tax=Etheostoma spectabile TaxID=54343 RepID=UPI0013AEA1BF|nr:uncharacterized protein LOC116672497 [Etheostoma spectabile]